MDDYIKYSSTRGGDDSLSYEEVLLAGLARDGGLFMPEKWPSFSHSCLLYTSPSPRDQVVSRMPSSA